MFESMYFLLKMGMSFQPSLMLGNTRPRKSSLGLSGVTIGIDPFTTKFFWGPIIVVN